MTAELREVVLLALFLGENDCGRALRPDIPWHTEKLPLGVEVCHIQLVPALAVKLNDWQPPRGTAIGLNLPEHPTPIRLITQKRAAKALIDNSLAHRQR